MTRQAIEKNLREALARKCEREMRECFASAAKHGNGSRPKDILTSCAESYRHAAAICRTHKLSRKVLGKTGRKGKA